MRIAIDCRKIRDGGIGTYLANLLRQWRSRKPPADFFLFHLPVDESHPAFSGGWATLIPHKCPRYSPAELYSLNGPLRRIGASLLFSPHYTMPQSPPCPTVVTIHDLIHLRFLPRFGVLGQAYAKFLIGRACQNADAILTVSEFSRRDIINQFPASMKKARVVPNGVDRETFRQLPDATADAFRQKHTLPEKFVLYVGALKAHKNPRALIEIANGLKLPLVAASHDMNAFRKVVAPRLRDPDSITLLAISDESEMALLYNAAHVLVQPSFHEGFGLPPLEAMACGLPVACSNAASLPEVVGDAALFFDPHDHRQMLKVVNQCWRDDGLRDILRARGKARIGLFDWAVSANRIFEIFGEVASK
jgi:alpha-1,3-rhamnosyl/mannosyltransferase